MKQIRLLIVDNYPLVRKGIRFLVSTEPDLEIVAEASNGQEAIRQTNQYHPDVVLMELVMPGGDGLEAIVVIKRCYPNTKIVVLTGFEDQPGIIAALEAGADGYLLKDADGEALLQAIHCTQTGGISLHPRVARYLIEGLSRVQKVNGCTRLTEREREVLLLVVKGLSNKGIAQALNLSEGTIKIHVGNILGKLNVASRIEAAMVAVQTGLITMVEADVA